MLTFSRRENESYPECISRIAEPYGLVKEVTEEFEALILEGKPENEAAFYALEEWDLLDYVEHTDCPQCSGTLNGILDETGTCDACGWRQS